MIKEYYTLYKLTINDYNKQLEKQIISSLIKIVNCYNILPLNRMDIIWNNHDKNMIELSKMFPKIEMTLHGRGQDVLDVWMKIYKNGELIDHLKLNDMNITLKSETSNKKYESNNIDKNGSIIPNEKTLFRET